MANTAIWSTSGPTAAKLHASRKTLKINQGYPSSGVVINTTWLMMKPRNPTTIGPLKSTFLRRGITTKKNASMVKDLMKEKTATCSAGMWSFSVTIMAQKLPLISLKMLITSMMPAVYSVSGV